MIFVKNHLESFPDCENVFASFFLQDSSGLIFEIQSALELTADTFEISYQMNIFLNKYHGRTCSCQHGLLALETPSHCAGRHFRTKLMSQYIGAGQNDRFDVRIQELNSKAKNPGGGLRKKVF